MRLFLDSSALAKKYVRETGTEDVLAWLARGTEVILSALSVPELISAFNRLRREEKLTPRNYRRLKSELAKDIAQATIVEITPEVLRTTIHCLEKAPLRTLDAVQLASALRSRCDVFLSADRRQGQAAISLLPKVEMV